LATRTHGEIILVDVKGYGRGTHVQSLRVIYHGPNQPDGATMDVDPAGRTCRVYQGVPLTRERIPLDKAAVDRFVAAAGFDPNRDHGGAISAEVMRTVRAFLRHEFPDRAATPRLLRGVYGNGRRGRRVRGRRDCLGLRDGARAGVDGACPPA
jgi:hypothetical protein